MKINDLMFNYKSLFEKKIYLYGAGIYGKRAKDFLELIGAEVIGFVDSNAAKVGTSYSDKKIYSIEEVKNVANKENIIVIITTLSHSKEVVESMENISFPDCEACTLYGLFFSLYFNMPKDESPYIKKIYAEVHNSWMSENKPDFYNGQAGRVYRAIHSLMKLQDNEVPVIINQPGKVGSNTIAFTLEGVQLPVYRMHGFLYPCEYENNALKELFLNKLKRLKKIKMITLIREPISKDIGHFFQKISLLPMDQEWSIKGVMQDDFYTSFKNYLSVITPLKNLKSADAVIKKEVFSHIDYYGEKSAQGAYWGWYEGELKKAFGIDLLEYSFDKEAGYTIIEKDNIELLVIKLEKLNRLQKVLADFVGLEELELVTTNEAKNKEYQFAYKQFMRDIRLSQEYLDFYYKDNCYTNHFYSLEERCGFVDKWKKYID